MTREDLEENPIASYLFFGKYKFRVKYMGKKATCDYCAESDHMRKKAKYDNFTPKLKNKKTTGKKEKQIIKPKQYQAIHYLTRKRQGNLLKINNYKLMKTKRNRMKTDNQPHSPKKTQGNAHCRTQATHRPRNLEIKEKNSKGERDDGPSSQRDPEISSCRSDDDELSEFQLFADRCRHELIQ